MLLAARLRGFQADPGAVPILGFGCTLAGGTIKVPRLWVSKGTRAATLKVELYTEQGKPPITRTVRWPEGLEPGEHTSVILSVVNTGSQGD